jgi:hypothetical protein
MSSSRTDTAATKRDVDSWENRWKFTYKAKEATTYDNLLLDGSISNADVRGDGGWSGLHGIPYIRRENKDVDTDILLSYLLTCDPPADVNGRSMQGSTPMSTAVCYFNTSALKFLINFGGDRTIKTIGNAYYSNKTPLETAKEWNHQEAIKLLTECFPSEE